MKFPAENRPLRRMITPVGLAAIAVGLFGCLAVYNATYHLDEPFHFLVRQVVWLMVSVGGLSLATAVPFAWHKRLLPVYCLLAYLPLVLVLFWGVRVNGMRGWFTFHGVFYQPGEMAKPAFVLSLAWVLDNRKWDRHDFVKGFLPIIGVLVFWTWPIVLQPDFGLLLIYGCTFTIVYVCSGGKWRHMAIFFLVLLPFLIWALSTHAYVLNRFLGFFYPESYPDSHGWHMLQFRRSLASGGLLGQSWGKGVWSQTYLPLGYSDSIFATLGEAIGFLGTTPFVVMVVAWAFYGYRLIRKCSDIFSLATVLGLTGYIGCQSFIHLSVNLGLMPPTGITLPLISYGGSSLLSTAIAIGLIESLARDSTNDAGQPPDAVQPRKPE